MMKLNMKVMAATLLAAASLGMAGNTYAAFNFGAFTAAVNAQIPATNAGATAAAAAAATATDAAATAAAAPTGQAANTVAVQQQQAAAVKQQQAANVNVSAL